MNEGLDKNATREQIAYSAHDKNRLGNIGLNLTNKNMSCDMFVSAENQIDANSAAIVADLKIEKN